MPHYIIAILLIAPFAAGCQLFEATDEPEPHVGVPTALHACLTYDDFTAMRHLVTSAEASLAEVVDCGRAELDLLRALRTRLIARDPALFGFTPDTFAAYLWNAAPNVILSRFDAQPDGRWQMRSDGDTDMFFEIRVTDQRGEPLDTAIFDIHAYLEGIEVVADQPPDNMLWDHGLQTRFLIYYEQPGPLAHLMNGGRPLPNPIEVTLSVADLIDPLTSETGAWDALDVLDQVRLGATLDMATSGWAGDVQYRVTSPGTGGGAIAERRAVDFTLNELDATGHGLALHATSGQMAVGQSGFDGGVLVYAGGLTDDGVHIERHLLDATLEWSCTATPGQIWDGVTLPAPPPQRTQVATPDPPEPEDDWID